MMTYIATLKRMRWSDLEREAIRMGIATGRIHKAVTRDELRLLILRETARA